MTEAERILHDLRRTAKEVLNGFTDCGGHYEYGGSMNSVEFLRDAWKKADEYWLFKQALPEEDDL